MASALAALGQRGRWTGDDDLVFPGELGGYLDGSAPRRDRRAERPPVVRPRVAGGAAGRPAVDEVMVNGTAPVWVEREGRLEATGVAFADDAALRHAIERILAPLGLAAQTAG